MSAPSAPARAEELPAQFPSLPSWPETPPVVDETGATFLVLAVGGGAAAAVARSWVDTAEQYGPTTLGVLDSIDSPEDRATVDALVDRARTGVRVMVVGGQYDVLRALSLLRSRGAHEAELRSFVTDIGEIPVFCGHCQTIFRAETAPGGDAECAGCGRSLAVHEHMAVLLGAFLGSYAASDARAGTL